MLMGASIGVLVIPRRAKARTKAAMLAGFALLATVPDWQLPHGWPGVEYVPLPPWGHNLYRVSHSLFVNLAIAAAGVALLGSWARLREWLGGWPVVLGAAAALLSHLLLDTFYGHGYGLAMFWPLSDARLALPLPWFSTVRGIPPPLDWHTVRVVLVEVAFYLPILIIAVVVRKLIERRRGGHHAWMPSRGQDA